MSLGSITIGLVGDRNDAVVAHRAIPIALQLAGEAIRIDVKFSWVPTEEILDEARLAKFNGIWCVPASPYRNMAGALLAIRFAREQNVPFLGTCGGFQHAIVEYARNVLDWQEAEHGETAPDSQCAVIAPLSCSLIEVGATVQFVPGTHIAKAYGTTQAHEGYHCSYGINPEFQQRLTAGPLRVSARDAAGDIRAVESETHPFFVATLFQPERAALQHRLPPLVAAFVRACAS